MLFLGLLLRVMGCVLTKRTIFGVDLVGECEIKLFTTLDVAVLTLYVGSGMRVLSFVIVPVVFIVLFVAVDKGQ